MTSKKRSAASPPKRKTSHLRGERKIGRLLVIDTHFAQRGRVSRMLVIFAHNPQILGVGIDEDTAVEVRPGDRFHVIGNGPVFVFDGTVTHSNAPEAAEEDVIAMTDSTMHVLPSGYGFDLTSRRPILRNGEHVPAKGTD